MKALEFEGRLFPDDRMEIPDEIARQIPAGSDVRVILLLGRRRTGSLENPEPAAVCRGIRA